MRSYQREDHRLITAKPRLVIEMIVDCPECEHTFDLVADTKLNEEGWLLDQVLPAETWTNAHDNFECSAICPKCSVDIDIKGVDY